MSHSDAISNLPECFSVLAETENSPYAAIAHNELPFYALQFHPEVVHTKNGIKILENFLYRIVNLTPDWTAGTFINKSIEKIRSQVGDKKVILGLSCLLYTSDAADDLLCVDLGGRRIIKKQKKKQKTKTFSLL